MLTRKARKEEVRRQERLSVWTGKLKRLILYHTAIEGHWISRFSDRKKLESASRLALPPRLLLPCEPVWQSRVDEENKSVRTPDEVKSTLSRQTQLDRNGWKKNSPARLFHFFPDDGTRSVRVSSVFFSLDLGRTVCPRQRPATERNACPSLWHQKHGAASPAHSAFNWLILGTVQNEPIKSTIVLPLSNSKTFKLSRKPDDVNYIQVVDGWNQAQRHHNNSVTCWTPYSSSIVKEPNVMTIIMPCHVMSKTQFHAVI